MLCSTELLTRPTFISYILNKLKNFTNILDSIMFAGDDTNLFYMNKSIKTLFETANNELHNVNDRFRANKLSLKAGQAFFHK